MEGYVVTTLIQVADKRGLSFIDEEGDMYTSKLLKQLICTSDGFEYIGKGGGMDLHTLTEENLFTFMVEISREIHKHQLLCEKKGNRSPTLTQLEKLHRFICEIDTDPYFYWKDFLILAKINNESIEQLEL